MIIEAKGNACEPFRELISAEIDGAASDEDRRAVAAHIAGCAACARARADYLSVDGTLGQARGERVPAEVWMGIERHINAGTPATAGGAWRGRAVRAAAVAAGLGLAFAIGRVTAPAPQGVQIAKDEISREAEAAAVAAVLDAFFTGPESDLNARVNAAVEAQPVATDNTKGKAAPKGSY